MADDANDSLVPLLRRARQSPGELDALFGHCRNYLLLLARAQIGPRLHARVDASDLVQQTMLEAYRDFGHFEGSTAAEWLAWLKRILAHNAANLARHAAAQQRDAGREAAGVDLDGSRSPAAAPGETPSQAFVRKERELLVADAIAHLAPDHQEVIVLRNLQQLPFAEIAQRMGRTRPAVQMLWMRALERLHAILAQTEAAL